MADVLRQGEAVNIHLPVGKLLIQNIVLMVVPISVGYIVNLYRPEILALFAAAVMAEQNNTAKNIECFIVCLDFVGGMLTGIDWETGTT